MYLISIYFSDSVVKVVTTVVESVQSLYVQMAEVCSLTHLHAALLGQHCRTSIITEKIPATKEKV